MAEFDGAAISRADRELLASLDQHPLKRSLLYGTSYPPPPKPGSDEAAQRARFADVVAWMLVNYAFCKSAYGGKGGVISLVDGEFVAVGSLRSHMQPYALIEEGPRGGTNITSPVDVWMGHAQRASIDKVQTRFDQLRPTFTEEGYTIYNRYRPPAHPTGGGTIKPFAAFIKHLVPDRAERRWLWHWLSHKARRPWIPMISIIMVAEEFGTGRGTLFDILVLLFGKSYVLPCTFTELTGTSAQARFNARMADALIAVIHEAVAEDMHQQAQRRLSYEALKVAVDPSPTMLRRFERKYHDATTQPSGRSTITATQHRDLVKLPPDDRRVCVLSGGRKLTAEKTDTIRAWMAVPENIGALYRFLLALPAAPREVFNPYDDPPPFAGRLEMIGLAKSRLEDAYEEAMGALAEHSLFTMTQGKKLIGYYGGYTSGDWSDKALHIITKQAYRLRDGRVRYNNRREVVYARTRAERRRWLPAQKEVILKALKDTEELIAQVIGSGLLDGEKFSKGG